jgi:hypothetical protein
MRRPDRLSSQIEVIQRYLRTARANYNRAYREFSVLVGKRRICPSSSSSGVGGSRTPPDY